MQSIQDLASAVQRVVGNVEKVIVGKGESVAFSLIAVICSNQSYCTFDWMYI
jgi:MoxR-like ATPase